jgi:hypothetical protein
MWRGKKGISVVSGARRYCTMLWREELSGFVLVQDCGAATLAMPCVFGSCMLPLCRISCSPGLLLYMAFLLCCPLHPHAVGNAVQMLWMPSTQGNCLVSNELCCNSAWPARQYFLPVGILIAFLLQPVDSCECMKMVADGDDLQQPKRLESQLRVHVKKSSVPY